MAREIEHMAVNANGASFHVAFSRKGPPLLLHGWPEYWATWTPIMERLGDSFRLIAPDLRGFGDSDKPDGDCGPTRHAEHISALVDAMGLGPVGIVSHDVGASVAQGLARARPDLVSGLFFFNLVYPGISARFTTPEHLRWVWLTYFNQSEVAPALLRGAPDGIRLFVEHFMKLRAHRKQAIDTALIDDLAANMAKPGNLEGGFAFYPSAADERAKAAAHGEVPPPIASLTCVRWTEQNTALQIGWADKLPDLFTDLDFAPFLDAGHFPHHEQPDRAATEIARFFDRLAVST